jgi:hypothetical protein
MALDGTYTGLLATIQEWLDDTTIAASAPDFVRMAEARFNRKLRTVGMEARATATAVDERTTLPADFRGMRTIFIEGSPDRPLEQRSLAALRELTLGETGTPAFYAIADGQLVLHPTPSGELVLDMIYFRQVPALAENGSNWLLTDNPDLYLMMALTFAEMRGWNDSRLPLLKTAADEMLDEVAKDSIKQQWGGAPIVPTANVSQVRGGRC